MKHTWYGVVLGLGAAAAVAVQGMAVYAAVGVRGSAGIGVTAAADSAGANVNLNGNVSGSSSSSVSSSAAQGSMGANANIDVPAGVGLQAAVQSGTVSASSAAAVVNLQGNAASLIQATSDLQAYDDLVVKARPAVRNIAINNDGTVAISYVQPAKFLGLFPASLTGEIDVNASGAAAVRLPWYAFLYAAGTANVQSEVQTAVAQSGTVSAGTQAQGSAVASMGADASANLRNQARIVNAVTAALQAQADANASTSAGMGVQSTAQGSSSVTSE